MPDAQSSDQQSKRLLELQEAKLEAEIAKEEYEAKLLPLEEKRLKAEIEKEEHAKRKLALEVEALEAEKNEPFYSSREFLRPVIAGIALALIFSGYVQYIFLPTQVSLSQKADTAEYTLEQNIARHNARIAKLELVKTGVEQEAKASKLRLNEAEARLKLALDQNKKLITQIAAFEGTTDDPEELEQLKATAEKNKNQISDQLATIEDQRVKLEELGEAAKENILETESEGWIYIGYYPNEEWNYQTINIESGAVEVNKNYTLIKNLNMRSDYPKLSWFKYDYGQIVGFLVEGQKVVVKETKLVGRSKVWARVKLVNS